MGSQKSKKSKGPVAIKIHFVCLLETNSSFSLDFTQDEFKSFTIHDFHQKIDQSCNKLGFIPTNMTSLYDNRIDNINTKKPLNYLKLMTPIFFDPFLKFFVVVRGISYPIIFNKFKITNILQLKAEISSVTEIPIESLHLEFEGNLLSDDIKSLNFYDLKFNSIIAQSKIYIKFQSRHNPFIHEGYFLNSEKVSTIVNLIRSILNLRNEELCLNLKEVYLNEDSTLNDYFFEIRNVVNVSISYKENMRLICYNTPIEILPLTTIKDFYNILIEHNVIFPDYNFVLIEKSSQTRLNQIDDCFESYLLKNDSEILFLETFQIKLIDNEEAVFSFDVDENLPLLMLKHYYSEITNIPISQIILNINGDNYGDESNNKTLINLNICRDSTLRVSIRSNEKEVLPEERISFKRQFTKVKHSRDTPIWRIMRNGLNIEGTCLNRSCTAYKEKVICPIISDVFDIKDIELIICPICKKGFVPEGLGFVNCKYSYAAIKVKKEGQTQKIQKQKWVYVGKKFKYFESLLNDDWKWEELKIFIKIVESREEEVNKIEEFCGFCKNIFPTLKNKELVCGHLYHKQCEIMMREIYNMRCYLCNK
jgi:hypothetical protein